MSLKEAERKEEDIIPLLEPAKQFIEKMKELINSNS